MSKIVQREIEINGKVPQEVQERVRNNLKKREIDFSDVPELTEWLAPPVVIKVVLDNDTANTLNEKAAASHQTPAQGISKIVKSAIA
jgi:hypothetical protein